MVASALVAAVRITRTQIALAVLPPEHSQIAQNHLQVLL